MQKRRPLRDLSIKLHHTKKFKIGPGLMSFLGAFAKLRNVTISFVMSGRMEQLSSHWTDFHESYYLRIFQKSVEKGQVSLKSDKNNRYFNEDQYKFVIISRSFPSRMRNVLDKSCRENQNTHFVPGNIFSKIVSFMR
jgi:hypothetical protein